MIKFRRLFFATTLATLALMNAHWCAADISLPKYFSDHMVLQQNRSMRVWGKSNPTEKLVIKFKDQQAKAVADAGGNWSVQIQTGPAGGPFELEVASETNETKVVFSNVLVGEVWVCGGEENMSIPVSQVETAQADIASAKNFPSVRLFRVDAMSANRELEDFTKVDPWYCCSAETIKNFSAITYFYARELSAKLNVPIGVIHLAGGRVPIESWIANTALRDAGFDQLLEHWKDQDEPNNPNAASSVFNAMVSPLAQTPIAGIVWYHGISNIGRGDQYSRLLPLMIKNWREHFSNNDLAFYFVQPAPYRFEDLATDALPEIWDAQLKTFNNSANTGLVVTTDLAEPQLVHNQHKLTIAKRLANWAFGNCYRSTIKNRQSVAPQIPAGNDAPSKSGLESSDDKSAAPILVPVPTSEQPATQVNSTATTENITNLSGQLTQLCSGPVFKTAKLSGSEMVISFRFADSGLVLDPNSDHGFTICGEDKKFLPANIRIEKNQIIVSHPEIADPVATRHGWTDTARPVLTNSSGLPASPFRSDRFSLPSSGIEF